MTDDELNLSDMNWCKRTIDSLRQQVKELEERNHKDTLIIVARNAKATEETKKRLKVEAELAALKKHISDGVWDQDPSQRVKEQKHRNP